jgi:hypothetical protein
MRRPDSNVVMMSSPRTSPPTTSPRLSPLRSPLAPPAPTPILCGLWTDTADKLKIFAPTPADAAERAELVVVCLVALWQPYRRLPLHHPPAAGHLCLLLPAAAARRGFTPSICATARRPGTRYSAPTSPQQRDSQKLLRGCLAHGWRGLRERREAAARGS